MTVEPGARVARATDLTFDRVVMAAERPVLVHFWAASHAPCLALAARLRAVAPTFAGRVDLVKVNLAENPRLAVRYRPDGTPALLFFRAGKVVGSLPPIALTGDSLERALETHAAGRL